MRARIVIVDDELDVAELFRRQFRKELRVAHRHGAHWRLCSVSAPRRSTLRRGVVRYGFETPDCACSGGQG